MKPKILKRKTVASSRLFQIETVDLEFSNGALRQFERLKGAGRGAVMVVPVLNQDEFLLIREYSVGVENYQLGFPKGLVDEGELAVEAANRELQEEIGYASNQLELLKQVTLAPGYFSHKMDIFLAKDLWPNRLEGDEPEPLEVIPWRFDQIDELLVREDFTEARSIAGLFLAQEKLIQEKLAQEKLAEGELADKKLTQNENN
jgi:ADP-ribose diphosphatase